MSGARRHHGRRQIGSGHAVFRPVAGQPAHRRTGHRGHLAAADNLGRWFGGIVGRVRHRVDFGAGIGDGALQRGLGLQRSRLRRPEDRRRHLRIIALCVPALPIGGAIAAKAPVTAWRRLAVGSDQTVVRRARALRNGREGEAGNCTAEDRGQQPDGTLAHVCPHRYSTRHGVAAGLSLCENWGRNEPQFRTA